MPDVPSFTRHFFVCTNRRTPDDPKGSCADRGSEDIQKALKAGLKDHPELRSTVRVNKAGCLDQCHVGPSIVCYPEGTWYANVTLADVPEIIDQHLVKGQPVERLRQGINRATPNKAK